MRTTLIFVFAFLFGVTTITTAEHDGSIFEVDPNTTVTPYDSAKKSNFRSVGSIRSCGGSGAAIKWKIEGSQPVMMDPSKCQLDVGSQLRRYEFEFVPANSISTLGIGFTFGINGQKLRVYKEALSNLTGTVEGLKTYVVRGSFRFPEVLQGTRVTVGHQIYKVANGSLFVDEVCAEADFALR